MNILLSGMQSALSVDLPSLHLRPECPGYPSEKNKMVFTLKLSPVTSHVEVDHILYYRLNDLTICYYNLISVQTFHTRAVLMAVISF